MSLDLNERVLAKYNIETNILKAQAILFRQKNDPFLLNELLLIIKFNLNNEEIISEYIIKDDELNGLRQSIYLHESNPFLYKQLLYDKLVNIYSKTIAENIVKNDDIFKIIESIKVTINN